MNRRVALAIVVLATVLFGSCTTLGGPKGSQVQLTAYFPRAINLFPHSSVKILGLPAGRVTKVDVVGREVKVVMKIDKDVPVPANARALIVPQSLIGERYVQLLPAYREGQPRIKPNSVIPLERTSVPVEPDEALAALKHFLDTLDPNATGRLVQNLSKDLHGIGPTLNDALAGVGQLTSTLADKDQALGRIIDHFDEFTATLRTREGQLGRVMDSFAQLTSLLAEERHQIESLVHGLGQVSSNALDLVSEHGVRLDRDLSILTRTLQAVRTNLDSVRQLLDAGPTIAHGLRDDFDPKYQRLDLRSQYSPVVQQAVRNVLDPLHIPVGDAICLPIDVKCEPATGRASAPSPPAPAAAAAAPPVTVPVAPGRATAPTPTSATAPAAGGRRGRPSTTTTTTPIDEIVGLLGGGSRPSGVITPRLSAAERVGSAVGRLGGLFRRGAGLLVGAGR